MFHAVCYYSPSRFCRPSLPIDTPDAITFPDHLDEQTANSTRVPSVQAVNASRTPSFPASSLDADLLYCDTKPGWVFTTMRFWSGPKIPKHIVGNNTWSLHDCRAWRSILSRSRPKMADGPWSKVTALMPHKVSLHRLSSKMWLSYTIMTLCEDLICKKQTSRDLAKAPSAGALEKSCRVDWAEIPAKRAGHLAIACKASISWVSRYPSTKTTSAYGKELDRAALEILESSNPHNSRNSVSALWLLGSLHYLCGRFPNNNTSVKRTKKTRPWMAVAVFRCWEA